MDLKSKYPRAFEIYKKSLKCNALCPKLFFTVQHMGDFTDPWGGGRGALYGVVLSQVWLKVNKFELFFVSENSSKRV